jgi:hypothetical protein
MPSGGVGKEQFHLSLELDIYMAVWYGYKGRDTGNKYLFTDAAITIWKVSESGTLRTLQQAQM